MAWDRATNYTEHSTVTNEGRRVRKIGKRNLILKVPEARKQQHTYGILYHLVILAHLFIFSRNVGKTVGGPLHVPGSETTLIIRGLRPKTRYFFRVKCENTLGESQFGAEVAITTLEERRYRDFCMFLRSRNLRGHLSLFLTE
ncbi:down syndrome cell adhesion molecule [Caerostris darwini]|uniref:Down syndrome cell adhesion molecule n=1 Tax=Caerostris darwini TaxID=1538125 RepID=A0AAV4S0W4_9ARAC|nr:down syndrome cell adhesion molecule [Caerostris darwini]